MELTSDLVRFDTTARNPEDPPRDEAALQDHLARRLRAAGAEVDLWEPSTEEMAGKPLVPPGLGFEGRPQLVARFKGAGGGRSLLLNGHIDAVSVEPREQWTSDPFEAEVRDGDLYGRGTCDCRSPASGTSTGSPRRPIAGYARPYGAPSRDPCPVGGRARPRSPRRARTSHRRSRSTRTCTDRSTCLDASTGLPTGHQRDRGSSPPPAYDVRSPEPPPVRTSTRW